MNGYFCHSTMQPYMLPSWTLRPASVSALESGVLAASAAVQTEAPQVSRQVALASHRDSALAPHLSSNPTSLSSLIELVFDSEDLGLFRELSSAS